MQKLNSRFNAEAHKAKTEELVSRMRIKAARDAARKQNKFSPFEQSSKDIEDILRNDGVPPGDGATLFGVQAVSSGFIAEASQESLLEKEELQARLALQN